MDIKRTHPNKKKMLVGRGGRRGKTSGRGTKGQKARAGRKIRPALRDTIKKLPRLRGVTINKRGSFSSSAHLAPVTIPLAALVPFKAGETVSPVTLLEKRVISRVRGRIPKIKLLGGGEVSVKLTIEGVTLSKSAAEKILAAGGSITPKKK